jgi:hypothetical protein
MDRASLELCKELYELSGWDGTEAKYVNAAHNDPQEYTQLVGDIDGGGYYRVIPAYDLGYLLRKLPSRIEHDYPNDLEITKEDDEKYWAAYSHVDDDIISESGDTPEDAACKLAIELFKQGVLK